MLYKIQPVIRKDAEELATWTYPPPYEIYSLSEDMFPALQDPLWR